MEICSGGCFPGQDGKDVTCIDVEFALQDVADEESVHPACQLGGALCSSREAKVEQRSFLPAAALYHFLWSILLRLEVARSFQGRGHTALHCRFTYSQSGKLP